MVYYSVNEKLVCASRLKQFILMAPSVSVSTQCKEITEINIY